MDINTPLFQALLRQQNISNFKPFKIDINLLGNKKLDNSIKIDYRYVDLDNLFAYVKDDIFHICNQDFEDIEISKIQFEYKGLIHIGIQNNDYVYPSNGSTESIVIDYNGNIIYRNPKNYFYVGDNEFLSDSPLFISDFIEGIVYNIHKGEFVIPKKYDFWGGYKNDYETVVPIIQDKKFVQNSKENSDLQYLFSLKNKNFSPIHTFSYFLDKASKSITYYVSSEYRSECHTLSPICLWYAGGNVYAISINLLNGYDDKGKIIKSGDPYTPPISFEISVNNGTTFHSNMKKILGVDYIFETKYNIDYFLNNLVFVPTANALLIKFKNHDRGYYAIVVRDNGEISYCGELDGSSLKFTESNILILGGYESNQVEYLDIFGTTICYADKYNPDYQIFSRSIKEPTRFNSNEIACQKAHSHLSHYEDGAFESFYGVIDLKSGNVIIPPCFSNIQSLKFSHIFNESIHVSSYTFIVQIDNFLNGNLTSLSGAYLNDKLTLPISYSRIEFLKYKKPNNDDLLRYPISDESRCFNSTYSEYLLLQKEGLFGLATKDGREIITPCAEAAILLEKTCQHIVETDGEKRVWLQHIPKYDAPEYVTMLKSGKYNLIYKDNIVSDFVYSDVKIFSISNSFNEYIFIKAYNGDKVTLFFEGKEILGRHDEIRVYYSSIGNQADDNFDVVYLVFDNVCQSLMNNKGETIIPFSSVPIRVFRNYAIQGENIINKDGNILFNFETYSLIAEKSASLNEHLLCLYNGVEYIIIDGDGIVYQFEDTDSLDGESFSCGYNQYKFDVDQEAFLKVEDEEDDYYDYGEPDDYDYERDTYYALGGDDYDRFKEDGGSIDDMMDYMGY